MVQYENNDFLFLFIDYFLVVFLFMEFDGAI